MLREVHKGIYGNHIGALNPGTKSCVTKILLVDLPQTLSMSM